MAEIERRFKCNCKEILVECSGTSYLIICGKHINGGYCAFPKIGIAAELSAYDGDYNYNKKKLLIAFTDSVKVEESTIDALVRIITDVIQELSDVLPF